MNDYTPETLDTRRDQRGFRVAWSSRPTLWPANRTEDDDRFVGLKSCGLAGCDYGDTLDDAAKLLAEAKATLDRIG